MVGFLRRPAELAGLALIVVGALITLMFGSRLAVYNMTIVAIYATVVMALNLLLGRMWTRSTITTISSTLCHVAPVESLLPVTPLRSKRKALNWEADKKQSFGYFASAD